MPQAPVNLITFKISRWNRSALIWSGLYVCVCVSVCLCVCKLELCQRVLKLSSFKNTSNQSRSTAAVLKYVCLNVSVYVQVRGHSQAFQHFFSLSLARQQSWQFKEIPCTCMSSACSLFLMLKYHFALLSCALSSTLITALDEVSVYMDKCDSYQVTDRCRPFTTWFVGCTNRLM